MPASRSANTNADLPLDTAQPEMLIVGRVLGPHGVRGEMRIDPLTDDPARFKSLRGASIGGRWYEVAACRLSAGRVLLKLEGVAEPDAIRALSGEYLRIPAEAAVPLPEGSYYYFQLVGLRAETTCGESLGTLVEVLPLAANDVYVVRGDRGEVLLPATREVIKEIDLSSSRLLVEPVPGLLPWERDEIGEGSGS